MFKLKLSRWSSSSCSAHNSSTNKKKTIRKSTFYGGGHAVHDQHLIRRLRCELAKKQRQLELVRQRAAHAVETVRAEEHERLAFALASLRRRLQREKTAQLERQKEAFERRLFLKQGEEDEDDLPNNCEDGGGGGGRGELENEKGTDSEQVTGKGKVLYGSQIFEDFNADDDMTEDIGSAEMQLQDDSALAIPPFRIPRSNVWSCRDKFRRHSPLETSRSIMTTIEEEKEEYDWFEERRQLLQDNAKLNAKVQELDIVKRRLENEMQEVKDQNELLEFRILELEEDPSVLNHHRGSRQSTIDQGTNTDLKQNRKDDCTMQVTKKFLYPELWKYNEEKLNIVCEKLNEWADNKKIHLPEDINVLLQATALLEFLKQQVYSIPHENLVFEEKLNLQDASDKGIVEKLHHTNLSMSSSIDSGSDGLDMISQGGETGYSSDESVDTEEIYQLNLSSNDFSMSSSTGGPIHSPDKLEFETETSSQDYPGSNVIVPRDAEHAASKVRVAEMLRQIQAIQEELPRLRTKHHQQQAQLHSLNKDNVSLLENCLHLDETETNTLAEQTNKIELLIESEKSLRNAVAQLTDKENAAVAKITNLEKERDKLRLEAKQLLQLITETESSQIVPSQIEKDDPNNPTLLRCQTKSSIISTMKKEVLEFQFNDPLTTDTCGSPSKLDGNLIFLPTHNSDIQDLLKEIQSLQRNLTAKQIEIQNKKDEYDLKIEALKCDHEETMGSLEERLSSMQQKERDLRQRLIETTETKEQIEHQFKIAQNELMLEKSKRHKHQGFSSTCREDVYENQAKVGSKQGTHLNSTFAPLENHLNQLCNEAEGKSLPLAVDDGELHINGDDDNLLEKIHDMAREQARLKQRIFELEKKEIAYKETLQEADKIMADVEKGYKERIEELEQLEGKLRARIVQLEQSEKRLRQTVKHNHRNSEVGKFGELLDRLLETEAAEHRLNERIHDLQQKFQKQRHYIDTLEKEKRLLEEELQDQEELLHTINCMKRTEKEMCLRIEQLQTSESALQETLHQADAILAEREAKLQDQLRLMEAELDQLRRANDQMNISETDLKQLLAEAEEELARSSIASAGSHITEEESMMLLQQTDAHSSVFKQEIHPIRIHQMADLVEMNGQMELQILQLQSSNETLRKRALQLESELVQQSVKSTETDSVQERNLCLQLKVELVAKNCEVESLQDKLKLLETGNTAAELQTLSLHADEIRQLKEKLSIMSTNVENCDCCNCANCRPLLNDIESEVFILDQLISGSCSPDYSSEENTEISYLEAINPSSTSSTNQQIGKEIMDIHKIQSQTHSAKSAQNNQDELNSSKQLQNLQNQLAILQEQLAHKKKQAEVKEGQIQNLHEKVEKLEHRISVKEIEVNNLQNNMRNLHKENADLKEKHRKSELAEKVIQENLLRKKQDLKISTQQIQQLEQRLSQMGKQLKLTDELADENQSLVHKMQELEAEMQKKRDVERKLHAENLHLHHKVEAQRERVTSLQITKKEYKTLIAKYDLLEKQKKIVDQAVVPLKNKISHLNQKCKEKEQFINHLTKQKQLMSLSNLKSSKAKSPAHFINNEHAENHEHGQTFSSPELQLSLSSTSDASDRSNDSLNSHESHKTLTPSARSRIPRYVALSSPTNSPRSSESKNPSFTEVPVEPSSSSHSERSINSPRTKPPFKEVTHKKACNLPLMPTNFQVTRQVGSDSILVAWTPPDVNNATATTASAITGYQVFVNGLLNQKVRSPNRTKALLTSIDLSQPVEVAIRSVAESGTLSAPAKVVFDASKVDTLTTKNDSQVPPKRKCFIKCNHNPPKTISNNPFMELKLKEGDIATIFGARQANGFFFGEVNGQRGLIPAHALDEIYQDTRNLLFAS